jgi:hypothetical protein
MITSHEAIHDALTRRHPPIPAPNRVESHQVKQHLQQHFKARPSILILNKT